MTIQPLLNSNSDSGIALQGSNRTFFVSNRIGHVSSRQTFRAIVVRAS
jgi:hypothetical protein